MHYFMAQNAVIFRYVVASDTRNDSNKVSLDSSERMDEYG